MSTDRKSDASVSNRSNISGAHAILGVDIVSFSTLHDDDQIQAIDNLIRWINEALAFHSITEDEYRWSPAGDGGYLTFASSAACRKAIDVVFAICQKNQHPTWLPRNGEKLRVRLALTAGTVQEARELGQNTNIWGMGINMAERILSVAAPSQFLMSKQYYDGYIKGQRESEFQIGDVHWRTVKHGVQVEVLNVNRDSLCLNEDQAKDMRWQAVGGLWHKTVQEYTFLIHDAMKSGEPVAALAAAKFLLDLDAEKSVRELCCMIGRTDERPTQNYPSQYHPLFSEMPPDVLFQVIRALGPRVVHANEVICERGDPAESCFFPVSGTIVIDVPGQDRPIRIATGQIIGEFSLWIPNLARTARVRATDEALLLEIHEDEFERILRQAPHVAEVVYGIIKRRVLENVLKSKRLFPREAVHPGSDFPDILASCEKYGKEIELDLSKFAYILFNGSVQIKPPGRKPRIIKGPGIFGEEQVVGIISDLGSPDGLRAMTLEETVVVKLRHEDVRALQRFEAVRTAWNQISGQRIGEIQRGRLDPSTVERVSGDVSTVYPLTPGDTALRDFFVSYTSADKGWAEWIAWELEAAGHTVAIQAWDFQPGSNFVLEMQRATSQCQQTIAVLSENYLKAIFTQPEWSASFAHDPQGLARKLIPVRIDRCHPEGLLKAIVYIDLVGLDGGQARRVLLDGIKGRAKPATPPAFPGSPAKPISVQPTTSGATPKVFPGVPSRAISLWQEKLTYFLEQEPLITDPAQRFALQKQVEECRAKIRELGET